MPFTGWDILREVHKIRIGFKIALSHIWIPIHPSPGAIAISNPNCCDIVWLSVFGFEFELEFKFGFGFLSLRVGWVDFILLLPLCNTEILGSSLLLLFRCENWKALDSYPRWMIIFNWLNERSVFFLFFGFCCCEDILSHYPSIKDCDVRLLLRYTHRHTLKNIVRNAFLEYGTDIFCLWIDFGGFSLSWVEDKDFMHTRVIRCQIIIMTNYWKLFIGFWR